MDQVRIEKLLYGFFVANSETEISYRRIKNVSDSLIKMVSPNLSSYELLTKLLRCGLIEQINLSKYRLSPSCLLKGRQFQLGVNLPNEQAEKLGGQLIKKLDGLALYEGSTGDMDVPIQYFNVRGILAKCRSFHSVSKNLLREESERPKFTFLECYDPIEKKFSTQNEFIPGLNLYRLYSFSKLHFEYFFEHGLVGSNTSRSYRFERNDLETLNILKATLSLEKTAKGMVYRLDRQELSLDKYYPLPNTIERILFLNSAIIQGDFPRERNYSFKEGDLSYLQKIFNNKMIIHDEEYI